MFKKLLVLCLLFCIFILIGGCTPKTSLEGLPEAPSNLIAELVDPILTEVRVKLVWKDNSNNEDGFIVERKTSSGQYESIAQLEPNTTSYIDDSVSRNSVYSYRIKAYNDKGNRISNEFQIEVPIVSTSFEDETIQSWQPRGSGVSININSDVAKYGNYSLFVSGRSSNWHGAQIPLLSQDGVQYLQPGNTYSIKVWVYQNSGSEQKITLTMQRTNNDRSTNYDTIVWQKNVPNETWVELSGSYNVPTDAIELLLYVESPDQSLSYYIDGLMVK